MALAGGDEQSTLQFSPTHAAERSKGEVPPPVIERIESTMTLDELNKGRVETHYATSQNEDDDEELRKFFITTDKQGKQTMSETQRSKFFLAMSGIGNNNMSLDLGDK